jgi:hypothetical protein
VLEFAPITLRQARAFVFDHHRTHRTSGAGGLFAIALLRDPGAQLVGVAIAGRPVAGGMQDGRTLEVLRCCVLEGVPNGCSMLYRAIVRAGEAMGYRRVITYTLATERGASLRAAGFTVTAMTRGGSWSRELRPRARQDHQGRKVRWEVPADAKSAKAESAD